MVKKIISLKDIGRFSNLKSANGNEGDFAKVNVVYAPNACGKTTICDVFRSLGAENPAYIIGRKRIGSSTNPSIDFLSTNNTHWKFCNGQWERMVDRPVVYVYDQRFVKDNVLVGGQIGVEQKRNVYNLALGQKAVELNKAVEIAGERLAKASESVARCESVLAALIPRDQQIEEFRKLEKVEDVDAKIVEVKERISAGKNRKSKADQIRKHALLQKLEVPVISRNALEGVLSATLDDAALVAEERIKEHIAKCTHAKAISVEWIKQGHEGQVGMTCPYCGQNMSQTNLPAIYSAFFSGSLKQQEELRNQVRKTCQTVLGIRAQDEIINRVKQNSSDCEWWMDACGLEVELPVLNAVDVKDKYERVLNVLTSAIDRKLNNLTVAIPLEENEVSSIDAINSIASAIKDYNNAVEKANGKIQDLQVSVETINTDELTKNLACLENQKKRYEEDVVSAYQKYDEAIKAKREAQTAKKKANEELKLESESVFESFGAKINEILPLFGVNFTVGNDGVNLRGGTATGQLVVKINASGSSAVVDCSSSAADDPSRMSLSNTLSGGDCSALGLAFFLARLGTDANIAASIVVIDDPYHDQDRSRQAQTISLLKRKANESLQFFLFSHNIEFAQMFLADKGIARNEIRAFEIPQLVTTVELKHGELPQLPSKSYETDYAELSGYVEEPERYQGRLKEVVGRIRPLLETYLRYKYPRRWDEKEWLGDMIGKIREAQTSDIIYVCKCLFQRLEDINNYTQRFHHRVTGVSADVPDSRELLTFVKMALEIVHHA